MFNITVATVRLHSEAVVWSGSGRYVLLYDKKKVRVFFNNFNYFTGNLSVVAFRFLEQLFTGCPRMSARVCYF